MIYGESKLHRFFASLKHEHNYKKIYVKNGGGLYFLKCSCGHEANTGNVLQSGKKQ